MAQIDPALQVLSNTTFSSDPALDVFKEEEEDVIDPALKGHLSNDTSESSFDHLDDLFLGDTPKLKCPKNQLGKETNQRYCENDLGTSTK